MITMKRPLLIGALLVLPLAFLAGRMGGAAAEETSAASATTQAAPAKSSPRSADTRRNPGKGRSPAWTILRKRASQSTDELIEELFVAGAGPGDHNMQLMDHLLATDPERLFRAIYDGRHGGTLASAIRRWSIRDPEQALPLLLGNEEPFAWRGQEFYDPHPPVAFNGMGMIDPEKGLAMIDALPPGQFESKHYWGLLEGIAGTAPEKVGGYFQKIMAKGRVSGDEVARLLYTYATADPQAALAWAKGQGDPIPEKLMDSLLSGLSTSDTALAARLYEEAAVKPAGSAYGISLRMARDNPDLDATWAWIERTSEPTNLQTCKNNALGLWARKNPDAATERLLAHPELMLASSYNLSGLIKSQGKTDEFLTRVEQLPPEQAEAIKRMMEQVPGVPPSPPPPGSTAALYATLKLMRKDPGQGEAQWRSMEEGQRQKMVDQLANSGGEYSDPALVMKVLVEGKADPNAKGWSVGLARLAIVDTQAAARIAEQVPPGKARSRVVEAIFKNWSVDDTTAATAWRERMLAGQPAGKEE